MKINKSQRKFIKKNYDELSVEEIAEITGLTEKTVEKYVNKLAKTSKKGKKKPPKKKAAKREAVYANIASWKDLKRFLKENIYIVGGLMLLVVLVFINTTNGEFVSDDILGYVKNPTIHSFNESLYTLNIHNLLFSLNYNLFGVNPTPLHIQSIILHMVNTLFVFIFVSMLFNRRVSLIAAFLFAVHPVNSEAVAWISGRVYIMYSLLIFGTLNLYVIYRRSSKPLHLGIAIAYFAIGYILIRNPWVLTVPILIGIVDYFFLNTKIESKSIGRWGLFLGISLAFFFLDTAQKYGTRVGQLQNVYQFDPQGTPFLVRLPYIIFMALELLIFPKDLTIYHEGEQLTRSMFNFMIAVTVLVVIGILVFWKKDKRISGLLAFIFVTIAPAFSPVQIASLAAERYMYLGLIAFTTLIALLFLWLEKVTNIKKLALYLAVGLVVIYTFRTIVRNNDWTTRKSLWEATAQVSPRSARVYNNLGDVYMIEGNPEKAIEMFEKAIEITPNYADATHNLGNTYLQLQRYDEAEEYFKKAFQIRPNLYQSVYSLGVIQYQRKNYPEAIAYFKKTLEINPNHAQSANAIKAIQVQMQQEQQKLLQDTFNQQQEETQPEQP